MDRLHLGLQLSALALNGSQFTLELINLFDVTGALDFSIRIFKLVEILQFNLDLIFLTRQLHLELFSFDVDLVGVLSLITDLLSHLIAHHLKLLLHHSNSTLGGLRLLLQIVVSVLQLIVDGLLTNVLLSQISHVSLQLFFLFLHSLALILLIFQLGFASLSSRVLLLALLIEALKVGLTVRNNLLAKLVLHVFELTGITLLNLVVDASVSLGASVLLTIIIDFNLDLAAILLESSSLLLTSSDLVLNLLNLHAEILKLGNVLAVELIHALLRVILDLLSRSE